MLQLIKHAQKVIVNYVIPKRVSHNGFYFTSEQLAAGHTIVEMKLAQVCERLHCHYGLSTSVDERVYDALTSACLLPDT